MRKKAISVIAMSIAGTFILTSGGTFAVASESSEVNTDKIGVTVESVEEATVITVPDELDWEIDQIAALSGILTGVEDKAYEVGTAHKYNIHKSVTFNKDIVAGVLFNTANIDFATPGEYSVTYLVYFNRDALLNYMSENNIDTGSFPGLSEATADRIKATVNGKVTVSGEEGEEIPEEEIAYEETVEEEVYDEEVYEEEDYYEENYYEEDYYDDSSYSESNDNDESDEAEASSDEGTFTTTILDCNDPSHGYTGVFNENGELLYKIDEW